jgi:hypothetical protein
MFIKFTLPCAEIKLTTEIHVVIGTACTGRCHMITAAMTGDGSADKNIAKCFYLSEYKMSFEFHKYHKTSIVV